MAVGDIFLDRGDPASAFAATRDLLNDADIAFANVEAPISDRGELRPWASKFPLRMRPAMVDGLVSAGFDVVSLANNHTMDWSTVALLDTVEALRQRGIATVGAGADLASAREPVVIDRRGLRVGFLAFQATEHDRPDIGAKADTPGLNQLRLSSFFPDPCVSPSDIAAMRAAIGALRKSADVVVISFHWGIAGSVDLAVPQLGLAREAAAAGADLIIGHHAHVPQALAGIGGTAVAFGLGNFAFDWEFPHFVSERLVLDCDLGPHGVERVIARPATVRPDRSPQLVDPGSPAGAAICASVVELSASVGPGVSYDPASGVVLAMPTRT